MAKQTSLYLTKAIQNASAAIQNADGTTAKNVFTAGADDSIVKGLIITSDDTAARNVSLEIYDGTNARVIATIAVPIGAGTNGTAPAIDALNAPEFPGLPVDNAGKRYLPLKATYILRAKMLVAVTSGKTVNVIALAEDY